jgi:dihydrofolate reductase
MATTDSRVTVHMAASLDGYIARKDGGVEWLETSDEFAGEGIPFLDKLDADIPLHLAEVKAYEDAYLREFAKPTVAGQLP